MYQAMNKEVGCFSITLVFDAPQISLHYNLTHYGLKLRINLTSAALGSARKRICLGFQKKIRDMFTWLAIWCCHLICGGGKTKSPCKFYAGKNDLKKEKTRSLNDVWKVNWKSGIRNLVKASRGNAPGPHKGGLQHLIWNPRCKP